MLGHCVSTFRVALVALGILLGGVPQGGPCEAADYYKGPPDAQLAPRSALVIGVSIYQEPAFPQVPNAVNDSKRIGDVLRRLGFDIYPKVAAIPLTRQVFKRILYDYVEHVKRVGGVSLIYFAGHGLSYGKDNYLVPSDALILYSRDIREELIPLDLLSEAFEEMGDVLQILILDACRDEGLGKLPSLGKGTSVEMTSGLRFKAPRRMAFARSADEGQKARDGKGEYSPFADALATFVPIGNEPIDTTFKRVARFFEQLVPPSDPEPQEPRFEFKGGATFFFAPTVETFEQEKKAWDEIDHTKGPEQYSIFLSGFPAGYFASRAREVKNRTPVPLAPPSVQTVRVTVETAALRKAPAKGAEVVERLQQEGRVIALAEASEHVGWTKVQTQSGARGYVATKQVEPVPLVERRIVLTYDEEGIIPPAELSKFLTDLSTQDVKAIQVNAQARDWVKENRVTLTTARLLKIQSAIVEKQISSGIVETTISRTDNPGAFNRVELRATIVKPASGGSQRAVK